MSSETDREYPVTDRLIDGIGLLRGSTPEQRGVAIAVLMTFFGVAYLGPALTRWTTPRTRAQRLADEAAYQTETFRRRARKTRAKLRKQARRLGGGTPRR